MREFLQRLYRFERGELAYVIPLCFILLCNSFAMQLSDVVAISGILSEGGSNTILIVWTVDMVLILVMTSLQALIVDRVNRLALIRWMLLGLAGMYIILRLLFLVQGIEWFNYAFLFVLADQQWLLFPLFFWVLANDLFNPSATRRLFPLIAGVGFVGQILGLIFAAWAPDIFSRLGVAIEEVLIVNVSIYIIAFLVSYLGLHPDKLRKIRQKPETVKETLAEGWDFVREVPSFRFLTMAILAMSITLTIIEFRFLTFTHEIYSDVASYQQFYSFYQLGMTLAALAIQTFFTAFLINRIGLKNVFLVLPMAMVAGAAWMLALPFGVISNIGGMALPKLTKITIDESGQKSFQALVPEERRGRVSIFIDSYLDAAGTIIGCLLTGLIVYLGFIFSFSLDFYIYLGIAFTSALFALWAISRMRVKYDSSLLNWRLKRRSRRGLTSVLNKLDL
ncbi:MAG: hypothetical protein KDI79_30400 [Anaerolineae bacterium]|nr:hypothetical protein [Anaerolineae bacterium]